MLSDTELFVLSAIVAVSMGVIWYRLSINRYQDRYSSDAEKITGSESIVMAYLAVLALGILVANYGYYVNGHPVSQHPGTYATTAIPAFGSVVLYEYKRWKISEKISVPAIVIPPVVTLALSMLNRQYGIINGIPVEVLIALLPAYWLVVRIMFDDRDPDM